MGRTAFFLRAYNDIDHLAPVIWKFVKKGATPLLVFHTDIDYENDVAFSRQSAAPSSGGWLGRHDLPPHESMGLGIFA